MNFVPSFILFILYCNSFVKGLIPTLEPTIPPEPTFSPSRLPTRSPTTKPTWSPTTAKPSRKPTSSPTFKPSATPTFEPTRSPTMEPTSWYNRLIGTSPNYKASSGFGFATVTSAGAAVYWGMLTKADYPESGDKISHAKTVVASEVNRIIPTRTAFVALLNSGRFVAWGAEEIVRDFNVSYGPLVDLDVTDSFVANDAAFAGITTEGNLVSFGAPGHGANARHTNISQAISSRAIQLAATAGSFAVVGANGNVMTWGPAYLGGGVSSETNTDLADVERIVATRTGFAALTSSGRVIAWGDRFGGGDASLVSNDLLSDVEYLVSSQSVFIAIKSSGALVVWGNSEYGGDASQVQSHLQSGVIYIAQTAVAFAALKEDGSVVTWGEAGRGGDSSAVSAELVDIRMIYSNRFAFAALNADGGVVVWGDENNGGELPSDLISDLSSGVSEIFSTHRAFAALKASTGELFVWGNAHHGGNTGVAEEYLRAGVRTVCSNDVAFTALLRDGSAAVWGHSASVPFPGLLSGANFTNAQPCA